jgi:cholest-4-en-3-one 26-monooxygenase
MIGADDPEFGDQETAGTAAAELYLYAAQLREEKREEPDGAIASKLLEAEVEGHQLTDLEFDMFFLLLSVAGNETTRNATAHGMRALLKNPDQFDRLKEDRTLLNSAIEEILRWATPVMYFRRTAMKEAQIRGREIKPRDKVVMWHISANRDEEVFDEPFRFDIARDPNEHIAFGGGGPHFCLGANLARLELRLIFDAICDRLPDLYLNGEVEMLRSNFIGGIKHMPVKWAPAA